jgi:uncharacterized membrane protein
MRPEPSTGESAVETQLETLLKGAVLASALCLVAGLALWLVQRDSEADAILLRTGLLLLMSTPVLRVLITAAEAIRQRDWVHLGTIATVTGCLGLTLTYALIRL